MSSPQSAESTALEPTPAQVYAQLDKVVQSPQFRSAEMNRALLTFLVTWMVERAGHHLKESEIAVSVFHRQANSFDPQSDSVARVQMTRLRAKLQEYYLKYGAQDELRFEIPKGSYQVVAVLRPVVSTVSAVQATETPVAAAPSWISGIRRLEETGRRSAGWVSAAVALMAIGAGLEWARQRASFPALSPHLAQFWRQVCTDRASNLIVFSNPRLAGTLFDGTLRYYDPRVNDADPGSENLTYSGSGDVPAVSALSRIFYVSGKEMNVRSGATLNWEQAKESNLIFVGRPQQNPSLRLLPRLNEFNFQLRTGIVDSHPPPGGQSVYSNTPHPYSRDWAIIAFLPGLSPGRTTLILAGTVTYGSEAAAEFTCDESKVGMLLERLNVKPGGKLPFFEALIEVRINRDVPVWSQLRLVRLHSPSLSTWQPLSPYEQ